MPDFKKNYSNGPRRPFNKAGGRSFGPRDNDSKEMFDAQCNKCGTRCSVPFRPNGKKPVYCKDCFVRDDSRESRPFEKRSYGPERSFSPKPQAPAEDPRIGAMQRELTVIHEKLDTLIQSLEASKYSSILAASAERAEKPTKAKVVKKVAAPKKPAAKKVAKKK